MKYSFKWNNYKLVSVNSIYISELLDTEDITAIQAMETMLRGAMDYYSAVKKNDESLIDLLKGIIENRIIISIPLSHQYLLKE